MKLASAARAGVRAGPSGGAPPGVLFWIAVIGLLLVSYEHSDDGRESPDEAPEVPRHPGGVRHQAGDQSEGGGGLVYGHVSAVERAAAGPAGGDQQGGLQ